MNWKVMRLELWVLGLFCAGLLVCMAVGASILWALLGGLLLFLSYGRRRGFGWKALGQMALSGILAIKNILLTFLLIGMLTAVWRASGVIPVIVCYAARLLHPAVFLPMVFLLNSLVSVLTGTSFGTAATMGVICFTIGAAMGLDPLLVGGAVLSGIFVGDRCSPVSTSALLIAELTGTDIFANIRAMLRTGAVPFGLTLLFYGGLGWLLPQGQTVPDLTGLFRREFLLHPLALLPAGVILVLSQLSNSP